MVIIDRIAIKERAKMSVAGAVPAAALVTLVYLLVTSILAYIISELGKPAEALLNDEYLRYGVYLPVFGSTRIVSEIFYTIWSKETLFADIFVREILAILLGFITLTATTGFNSYTLLLSRRQPAGFRNLRDGVPLFFKIIAISILTSIFIFLWTLLFIIPGIIASYRYRLSIYVMLDNPDFSALECIRESKRLTQGFKGALFVLDLSFIGWYLLCVITLGILLIWKLPYFETTYASFYNETLLQKNVPPPNNSWPEFL